MATGQKKIRVLFVEVTAQMGGVEVTTLQTASLLDHKQFDVTLVVPEEGDLTRLAQKRNIQIQIIMLPKFPSVSIQLGDKSIANPVAIVWDGILCIYAAIRLTAFLRKNKADLLCTKGLFAHMYGGLAAYLIRIPCVWHVQEIVDSKRYRGLFLLIFKYSALLFADKIIADADAVATQFDLPKLRLKTQVIYNGVDIHHYKPTNNSLNYRKKLCIPSHYFVIGCVARLMRGKGQHVIIEAFYLLAKKYPELFLILVGKGLFDHDEYEIRLRYLVQNLKLEGRVLFLGFIEDSAIAFNAFDIAVHNSLEPDSPLSVVEAMMSGCPLILSNVPGCREMVKEGDAILIPPYNPVLLAEMIELLYKDSDLRKRMSKTARNSAIQRFSLKHYISQIEKIFSDAIQSSH